MRHAIAFALLTAAACAAAAQPVYRCGNSYGPQPCEGATTVQPAAAAPSGQEAARAREAAKADQRRADALEKARLAQEAAAPKAVVLASPAPAASAAKSPVKPVKLERGGKPEQFTAVSPRPAKDKK